MKSELVESLQAQIFSIKDIRRDVKITQDDIAWHCNTTVQTVCKHEQKQYQTVTVARLLSIMKYINKSLNPKLRKHREFIEASETLLKVSQNVKRCREMGRITQQMLADVCEVNNQTICRWEQSTYLETPINKFMIIIDTIEKKRQEMSS